MAKASAEPAVLFAKPQSIAADDKAALASAGIIVVEVEDPGAVKLVKAHAEVSGGDMMMAAMKAINEHGCESVKGAFVKHLMARIEAK